MTKFEMNYRKSDIIAFFNDNVRSKLMRSLLILYCSAGLIAFLLFICLSLAVNWELSPTKPFLYIFPAVLAVVIFLAIKRSLRTTPDKMYKDFMSVYDKDTVTCSFGIDRVFIKSTGSSGSGNILYSDLERVVESDNYFYLFVNSEFAQIIKKSSIVEGTVEKTVELLKNGVSDKYKDITKLRKN